MSLRLGGIAAIIGALFWAAGGIFGSGLVVQVEREQARAFGRQRLDLRRRQPGGPQPLERQAHRRAKGAGLDDRRVAHAYLAELLDKAFGDLERPAVFRDVLTQEDDALVSAHGFAQAVILIVLIAGGIAVYGLFLALFGVTDWASAISAFRQKAPRDLRG